MYLLELIQKCSSSSGHHLLFVLLNLYAQFHLGKNNAKTPTNHILLCFFCLRLSIAIRSFQFREYICIFFIYMYISTLNIHIYRPVAALPGRQNLQLECIFDHRYLRKLKSNCNLFIGVEKKLQTTKNTSL